MINLSRGTLTFATHENFTLILHYSLLDWILIREKGKKRRTRTRKKKKPVLAQLLSALIISAARSSLQDREVLAQSICNKIHLLGLHKITWLGLTFRERLVTRFTRILLFKSARISLFWHLIAEWNSTNLFFLIHFALIKFMKMICRFDVVHVFFEDPRWFGFLDPHHYEIHHVAKCSFRAHLVPCFLMDFWLVFLVVLANFLFLRIS